MSSWHSDDTSCLRYVSPNKVNYVEIKNTLNKSTFLILILLSTMKAHRWHNNNNNNNNNSSSSNLINIEKHMVDQF